MTVFLEIDSVDFGNESFNVNGNRFRCSRTFTTTGALSIGQVLDMSIHYMNDGGAPARGPRTW